MYLLYDNHNYHIQAFLPFPSTHLSDACSIQSLNPLELIITKHQSVRKEEDNYDPDKEKHDTRET